MRIKTLLFLLIFPVVVCAQVGNTSSKSTYSIKSCKITVALNGGAEFKVYENRGNYSLPNLPADDSEDDDSMGWSVFDLFCLTGEPADIVRDRSGGHQVDGKWVFGPLKQSFLPEEEFKGEYIAGNTWKGTLTVRKDIDDEPVDENERMPPDLPKYFLNFCLQEKNGVQVVCGSSWIFQRDGFQFKTIRHALETIEFANGGSKE